MRFALALIGRGAHREVARSEARLRAAELRVAARASADAAVSGRREYLERGRHAARNPLRSANAVSASHR